jgi:hypothetical protein
MQSNLKLFGFQDKFWGERGDLNPQPLEPQGKNINFYNSLILGLVSMFALKIEGLEAVQ